MYGSRLFFCLFFRLFMLVYPGRCPRSPLPFCCPKRKRKRNMRLRRFAVFWFFTLFFWFPCWFIRGVAPIPHFLFGAQKGSEKSIGGFAAFCFLFKTAVFRQADAASPLTVFLLKSVVFRQAVRLRLLFFA